jgi:mRNA interferase MazF
MIQEGQVVLFRFPQTNQAPGKLRPALVIRRLPGPHDDWLICMISSQLSQQISEFDEIISGEDTDFEQSGLKTSSIIRISRLAVVNKSVLLGSVGNISARRLNLIKSKISDWIEGTQ